MDFHSKASNPDTLASPWYMVNRLPICEEETEEVSQQPGNSFNKIESIPLDLKIRSSRKM